jgi:hypothetical protein
MRAIFALRSSQERRGVEAGPATCEESCKFSWTGAAYAAPISRALQAGYKARPACKFSATPGSFSSRERLNPRAPRKGARSHETHHLARGTGQLGVYCGYHTQTTSIDSLGNPYRVQYSFIPWQNTDWPVVGQGCGLHSVNATSNSFGNGVFDSWSVVIGHEYSEAVTDPDNFFAVQDGWNDDQTYENGDKCAWTDLQNIKFGDHVFAMQPEWSNEAFDATGNGCVYSR